MTFGSACVDLDPEEPRADVQQDLGGGCDEWMCGTNSPLIANFGFWDLQLPAAVLPNGGGRPGAPNRAGVVLQGFTMGVGPGAVWYRPKVVGGKLIALPTTSTPPHNVALTGTALVNGAFMLRAGGHSFRLRVTEVSEVASWAQPPSGGTVYLETYRLDWAEVGIERFSNVCSHPGGRDETGMNGPLSFHTLLFEGDRINAEKKTDTAVDLSWFNLGCAGSALAKLALSGHTEAARNANTFATTLPERQTMLKMLTGAYCEGGKPFTVAGQPLNWADDRGTMKMASLLATPPRAVVREARWTPDGAACLDRPRLDAYWTPLGDTTFGPNVYAQVQTECGALMPPPCTDATLDLAGYHLITASELSPPPP